MCGALSTGSCEFLSLVSHYMVISPDEELVTCFEDRPGVGPHLCGVSLAQLAIPLPPLEAANQHDLIAPWARDLTSTKHSLSLSKLVDN